VDISLARTPSGISARVSDDGRGFAPGTAAAGAHGLLGMRERASLAGGTLHVASRPGSGTTIELRLREDAA
jgi:signal transduction histidine kinase